jgi:GTP 3',8-cyclase
LRISVTDRCNLRCTYCMPREVFDKHHVFLPHAELLSFEEIERLAKSFIGLGMQKIRLTGGEPLLRRNIEQLIEMLAKLHTPAGKAVEITLTTNAVLLSQQARSLKNAGLSRLTVSLDGLSDETFQRMNDSEVPVKTVLDDIAAAQRAGFAPVKVNMVVKRGVNDHEVIPMAEHFHNRGIVLRFIEYMDVGSTNGWRMDDVATAPEILEQIASHYPIRQTDPNYAGEVAERWCYADGSGEIGVIASITRAFCQTCTRARLSIDGKLYTCLFASAGADLRAPLREGATDQTLTTLIADHWQQRNDRYSQLRQAATEPMTTGTSNPKK